MNIGYNGNGPNDGHIVDFSRWTGGKLLLELQFTDGMNNLSATAIFDPASGLWQFVVHPQDDKLGKKT